MEKFYDKHYFHPFKYGGVKYRDSSGEREFCFNSGTVNGWEGLLHKLIKLLSPPESVLDVGAGLGTFVQACLLNDIDAVALEFSEYAFKHKNPIIPMVLWDIAETPWPVSKRYDWIAAIDVFEHLFDVDVDAVIREMKRVAKRFIIAKICTAQAPHEVWAAKKQSYPAVLDQAKLDGFEWLLASGHVNSQFPAYWLHKLEDEKWKQRDDLANEFKKKLPVDWRTTIILENTNWYEEEFGSA
jgi:hypothetical protein